MKYHTLYLSKTRKNVSQLSSAAVMIGALRVNSWHTALFCMPLSSPDPKAQGEPRVL